MLKQLYLLVFLLCSQLVFAQRDYDLFWVQFDHKDNSPYSIFHPQEYLSSAAIERRQKMGIKIDSLDLPVNPSYLAQIKAQGFAIQYSSKWKNGAVIRGNGQKLKFVKELPFVQKIAAIGFSRKKNEGTNYIGRREYKSEYTQEDDFYGLSENQIHMLQADYLHQLGFAGQNMPLAVFDGGFSDLRETPAFDSLRQKGQILGSYDFVQLDTFVYEGSEHGRDVLSCMAANLPGQVMGSAPQANYFLCKTEDSNGEYRIEEYNWLAAAEFADSVGVYLINSSLGYADFDDDKMDYAYVDLDGNTTTITQAADLAASRGILVVTSAGNEGNDPWHHLSAPGDADSILTVGATDRDGFHADFSSYGFDSSYLVKPNLAARGLFAIVAQVGRYRHNFNSGTSFSSPILAGAMACLWQALPEYSNLELIRLAESLGNQYKKPDTALGYGVPALFDAWKKARAGHYLEVQEKEDLYYLPMAKAQEDFFIIWPEAIDEEVEVKLYGPIGQLIYTKKYQAVFGRRFLCKIPNWKALPAGLYQLELKMGPAKKKALLAK